MTPYKKILSVLSACLICLSLASCSSTPAKPAEKGKYDSLLSESGSKPVDPKKLKLETFKTAEEAKVKARAALQQGDQDRAIFYYVKALELNNADTESLDAVAGIHAQRGNAGLSASAYQMLLNVDEHNINAREGLGLALLSLSRYDAAKAQLEKVLNADPNRPLSLNGLGVIADVSADYVSSIGYYNKALKLSPDSPMILNNFAYSLYLAGAWNSAEEVYQRILKEHPRESQAALNYGLLFARRGEAKAALDMFRRVLNEPQAYNELGYIFMLDGRYDDAINLLQKALDTSPAYFEAASRNLERARELKAQADSDAKK